MDKRTAQANFTKAKRQQTRHDYECSQCRAGSYAERCETGKRLYGARTTAANTRNVYA